MVPRNASWPAPWRSAQSQPLLWLLALLTLGAASRAFSGSASTDTASTDTASVDSAPVSAAPGLTALVIPEQPKANEPFTLVVEVRWDGPNSRFVLYPPLLTLAGQPVGDERPADAGALPPPAMPSEPDPAAQETAQDSGEQSSAQKEPPLIEKRGMIQTFQSKESATTYRYEYTLVAARPGVFPLGSLKLDYRDMGAEAASTPPSPLILELPSVDVRPGGARGLLGPILAGALALGGAVWLARRARARLDRPPPQAPAAPPPDLEALHSEARMALLEGRTDAVWAALQLARPLLSVQEDFLPPDTQLEESRLRARYGGLKTTPELERLVEHLGRAAAQHKKRSERTAEEVP